MFDIDGTLIQSYEFDSECFVSAVKEVVGIEICSDWSTYMHVTDAGILDEILDSHEVSDKQEIHNEVKNVFIKKTQERINIKPVQEVLGASSFLEFMKSMDNVVLSLATGGWYESAVLKLKSAGIDFCDIPIASSNDSFIRTEIMKISASKANIENSLSHTYFGDGSWDKKASEEIGYNFVLVGNRLEHKPNITNFKSINRVMACIGL
jgi:phosphoglycolate phosphatase-like HAD superfamily hydrolase